MKHTKTTAALVLGLLSLILLAGCGRGSALRVTPGGIAAGIVGEAIYDGLKGAAEESRAQSGPWKAGVAHPTLQGVVSTATHDVWQPQPGLLWTDSRTSEPRRFR